MFCGSYSLFSLIVLCFLSNHQKKFYTDKCSTANYSAIYLFCICQDPHFSLGSTLFSPDTVFPPITCSCFYMRLPQVYLQSRTKYFRQCLVFMCKSAQWEKFKNLFFNRFLLVLTKSLSWVEDWELCYNSMKF